MDEVVESQGTPETEASVEVEGTAPAENNETASQSNPFWKEVEEKLGPNNYAVIQPYLAKADAEYHRGITSANERLKPFQSFIEQGITPEVLTHSVNLVRQLNESPETIYEHLGNFLRENGRLPSEQELKDEIDEASDEEEDPQTAQIRQLQQQLEQQQQYLLAQQQQQMQQQFAAEAESWMDQGVEALKQAHPEFGQDDLKEVFRFALAQVNSGQEPDLNAAAEQYVALRDRFRNAPRAGASAPVVPGGAAGGGTPALGAQPSPRMSKEERLALVTQMLTPQK